MTEGAPFDPTVGRLPDFVLLAPQYPKPLRNGGEFIRTRVEGYRAAGLVGRVYEFGDTDLTELLTRLKDMAVPVLVHSPTPQVSDLIRRHLDPRRLAVWYHGYEVRHYRRLLCNFTPRQLAQQRPALDRLNAERFGAAAGIFQDDEIVKVFVSNHQRGYSEQDVGVEARNVRVIPNHIDVDFYRARVRAPEEACSLLMIRSFARRNYGNDVATNALRLLSTWDRFNRLRITIRGFGEHFHEEVAPLRGMSNISIVEGYATAAEMAALHQDHGVLLCPTRFDTQGVTLGEAMSSGMATISNPVAAIPEFTDERCSLLPRPDDPRAFAAAISHLVTRPDLMPTLSRNARLRVEEQCGADATIGRELALIEELSR